VSSRQAKKERLREERLARERAQARAAARRRHLQWVAGGGLVLAAVVALVVVLAGRGGDSTPAKTAAASSTVLASTAGEATGAPVDGIQCQTSEQMLFHIHAHLAVFVDGRQRLVPEGIGIPPPRSEQQTSEGRFVAAGACFYWLHSHTADGIIHIESPVQRTYTLGEYFDIWRRPLGRSEVGPARGPVTAYLDGRRFAGDPRSIPLTNHALVQLDLGSPAVPPASFSFPSGL
jgi:hypothetical protein